MNLNLNRQLDTALDEFFRWLPHLIGAVVIFIVGAIIASILKNTTTGVLRRTGIDQALAKSQIGRFIERATALPSQFLGRVVYWVIMLGTISLTVTALGIPALNAVVGSIYTYLPNVIAALIIFLVASAISAGVATLSGRLLGDTPTGKLLATILPTLTMIIAVFMILNQLQIAKDIVNITYAGLIATMVLAVGLSFGLGGREVASNLLGQAYEQSRSGARQAREDLKTGQQRADEDIERVKRRT